MDEKVTINRLNARGWGISDRMEVIGGLPGDEVTVRIHGKKRKKWKATLDTVLQPSPLRTPHRCAHVPVCGGCTWQQMDYSAQLAEKERRVRHAFNDFPLSPIIPCDDPWHYRNKMEFSFSQNRAGERFLGLVMAGSRGYVLNLTECHLVSPWMVTLLKNVREWWAQSGLEAYRMNDTGSLRTLIAREGKRTGDKLVMLTVSGNPAYPFKALKSFIAAVKASVPENDRLSIFLRVQQICKGSPTQFFEMHVHGPDHLLEKIHLGSRELTFKISPSSFFQPNTLQAEKLYSAALKMITGKKKHVMDLYAGTATLGIAMSSIAQRVTAIELNPHACFDAKTNQELNGIDNLEIVCGDVGKKLEELQQRPDFIPPDLVIVDPPRTGLDALAIAHLKALRPKEILYVSCNYLTQSANIEELVSAGYTLSQLQPVDQFPHTPHVENIAYLT